MNNIFYPNGSADQCEFKVNIAITSFLETWREDVRWNAQMRNDFPKGENVL